MVIDYSEDIPSRSSEMELFIIATELNRQSTQALALADNSRKTTIILELKGKTKSNLAIPTGFLYSPRFRRVTAQAVPAANQRNFDEPRLSDAA